MNGNDPQKRAAQPDAEQATSRPSQLERELDEFDAAEGPWPFPTEDSNAEEARSVIDRATRFEQHGRWYAELAWATIPVNGKKPKPTGWETTRPVAPELAAGKWSAWGEKWNMGVVLGPSRLAVVEYDTDAAGEKLSELLNGADPETPTARTGSGRLHRYYLDPGVPKTARGGLELRTGPHHCLLPPSEHPVTGAPYTWLDGLEPWTVDLAPIPEAVLDYFAAARQNDTAPVVEGPIPAGSRHDTLMRNACAMRRRGMGEAAILAALREENRLRCVPPLPDDEVAALAGDIADRYDPEPHEVEAASAPELERLAIPFTEIGMRSIEWFEKPLWQRSAFELLAGPKGTGKGTYLAGLAARVSNAGGNVLFIASEDSEEIDVKPRLAAAGADMARCFNIRRHVRLPDDVDTLRQIAEGIGGVELFVIDPVANHIGNSSSNSDTEVRHAIAPLNKLADKLECLLIGVRHVGKDRTRGALASILGSTAWVDTPRAVVMVAKDDADDMARHIQVVAGNRSANGAGEKFRIDLVPVASLKEPITLAVALGQSDKDIEDLLNPQSDKRERVSSEDVQALILRELDAGDKTRHELDAVAKVELGTNPDSVYKSGIAPLRENGQIRARKDGTTGPWIYSLA